MNDLKNESTATQLTAGIGFALLCVSIVVVAFEMMV